MCNNTDPTGNPPVQLLGQLVLGPAGWGKNGPTGGVAIRWTAAYHPFNVIQDGANPHETEDLATKLK